MKAEIFNIPNNGKEWFVLYTDKNGCKQSKEFRKKKQAEAFARKASLIKKSLWGKIKEPCNALLPV